MKKILGLTVAALMVMGLIGGGTWAYFTDPEQITGNLLSAGTLDLDLNGVDTGATLFNISNMAPGASGNGSATISNSGTLGGVLGIQFSTINNVQGTGGTEFEQTGSGELGAQAKIAVFIDVDSSSTWSSGDIGLQNSNDTRYFYPAALDYQTIDSYASDNWSDVYSGNMTSTASDKFYVLYDIPTTADNAIQGDSCGFAIYFILKQPGA